MSLQAQSHIEPTGAFSINRHSLFAATLIGGNSADLCAQLRRKRRTALNAAFLHASRNHLAFLESNRHLLSRS